MLTERSAKRPPANLLSAVELFTGAGGLAIAAHQSRFNASLLVEWNKDACATLRENLGTLTRHAEVFEGDIRDLDFRQYDGVDLVAGGPPCQPFSIGGKHRGKDDERNMIPEFIRAVRETRPRAFIMENVKGLTRSSFREYFDYIQLQLTYPSFQRRGAETWRDHHTRLRRRNGKGGVAGIKYDVSARVLNAADFGVPQIRQRVFSCWLSFNVYLNIV